MKPWFSHMARGALVGIAFLSLIGKPAQAAFPGLTFNGSATLVPGLKLRLTPSAPSQAGSVWLTSKRSLFRGFRTTFQFQMFNPPGGADGIAFVIQNDSNTALGGGGGGLGYHGIPNSVAIEFDTWYNPEHGDPNDNHISVHTNGTNPNSVDEAYSIGSTTAIPDLNNGKVHQACINYYSGVLTVILDGKVRLRVPLNLNPILDSQGAAYLGFTGATGGAYQTQDVFNWCLWLL